MWPGQRLNNMAIVEDMDLHPFAKFLGGAVLLHVQQFVALDFLGQAKRCGYFAGAMMQVAELVPGFRALGEVVGGFHDFSSG